MQITRTYTDLPCEFDGTAEQLQANYASHVFLLDFDMETRCDHCDCRPSGVASQWPCGADVPRQTIEHIYVNGKNLAALSRGELQDVWLEVDLEARELIQAELGRRADQREAVAAREDAVLAAGVIV